MADRAPNSEVATGLGICYVTTRTHLRSLSSKLATHGKVEAFVRARALGLIDRPSSEVRKRRHTGTKRGAEAGVSNIDFGRGFGI